MRILIVTPAQPLATGNHMTAARHAQGLRRRGHRVHVADTGEASQLDRETSLFRPDIIHLLHAYRSGAPWLDAPLARTVPMAVTLTGTDIHQGMKHPLQAPVIEEVLGRAAAVITQNPLTFKAILASGAPFAGRLHYLPPAVVLGDAPFSPRAQLNLPHDALLFLHPAGIRPVKRNLDLLLDLDPLGDAVPLALAFCGPVLDPQYAQRFFDALAQRPWARYLGVVPPAAIASAMREADVVLNHSESEGISTVLTEATVLGRPILARDIAGNAAVVQDAQNGFLYRDTEELLQRARLLATDPALRRRLARPRPDLYRPEVEADELEQIYGRVLNLA